MSFLSVEKQQLISLNSYKYETGQLNKNQYYSVKSFIENYPLETVEMYLSVFEAYSYLNPDKVISRLPHYPVKAFFQDFYKLLNLEIPLNFTFLQNYKYFPKLVKTAKRDLQDIFIGTIYKDFFSVCMRRDFKIQEFKNVKKNNKTQVKKLKTSGISFKKWVFHDFKKKYNLNYIEQEKAIIKESNRVVAIALGHKNKPGIITNNEKLYSRLAPYLSGNKIKNLNACKLALEEIKSSAFDLNDKQKQFYINSIDILLKRANDINILNNNCEIRFWDRNPGHELFIGSEIDTCLSVTRRSFFCLLDFFRDFYMNIIKINVANELAGLSYVFLVENENGNVDLLFDNIELKDKYKRTSIFTNQAIKYFKSVSKFFESDYFYLGKNYNDTLLPGYETKTVFLKKFACPEYKKYYIDTFNGFSRAQGKVEVYKIYCD